MARERAGCIVGPLLSTSRRGGLLRKSLGCLRIRASAALRPAEAGTRQQQPMLERKAYSGTRCRLSRYLRLAVHVPLERWDVEQRCGVERCDVERCSVELSGLRAPQPSRGSGCWPACAALRSQQALKQATSRVPGCRRIHRPQSRTRIRWRQSPRLCPERTLNSGTARA